MSPTTTAGIRKASAVAALALLLTACRNEPPSTSLGLSFPGSDFRIEVPAAIAPRLHHTAGLAQNTLDALRVNFDETNLESDISRINRLASTVELPIQPTTYQLLFHAKRLHQATEGAFDITTAPIAYAWGFKGGPPPSDLPDRLVDTIRYTFGMDKLSIREFSANLRYEANSLDLTMILPGFLTDHMVKRLRDNVVPSFLIHSKVVARAWGTREEGIPWTLPLKHPVDSTKALGQIRLKSGQACAFLHAFSSFREVEGRKISHVINPISGRPVDKTLYAVALAPSATDAQALATAALVRGPEGSAALLATMERCDLLVVTHDPSPVFYASAGFRDQFEPAPGFSETLLDFPPIPEKKPAESPVPPVAVSTNAPPTVPAP